MERQEVDSFGLTSVGYDEKEQVMEVEFKRTGGVYLYFDIPKNVYEGLFSAECIDRYFLRHIKRKEFEWRRIS